MRAYRLAIVALLLAFQTVTAHADRFHVVKHQLAMPVSLPSGPVTYDTSIGNGVDANGFTSLPLRAGAHRYYVNSSTGSDANTCTQAQSASTPKATAAAGRDCITQSAGDQVVIAEGTTYAERLPIMTNKDGFSLLYPSVLQSYDPADPTNEAKMGRATANRPTFTGAESSGSPFISPCCNGSTVTNYVAVRGLNINPGNITDQIVGMVWVGDGILLENNIFAYTGLSLQSQMHVQHHWILRGNALHGSFSSSDLFSGQQLYVDGTDTLTVEDNVLWHGGWKEGANRSDNYTLGGARQYTHPIYQQDPTNAIIRRNLIADGSADGGSHRGGVIHQNNLLIDNPANPTTAASTHYDAARPTGQDIEVSGMAAIGGGTVPDTGATDWGITTANGRPGSFAHYNLLARSSTGAGSFVFGTQALYNQPSYMDYSYNVTYLWNASGSTKTLASNQTFPSQVFDTYSNNVWDDPTSGTNTNISGKIFANAYTAAAFYTAAGYADKTAFINYAIAHPEAHIQRTARTLLMAGYGVTSPPLQGLTVYGTFVIGTSDAGLILGTQDGSTLTYSGFPSGFSISSSTRSWTYDGTGSASSGTGTITETAADGVTSHNSSIAWSVNAAPILTSVTASATGSTTATLSATTNTANGTLYWSVDTHTPQPAWPLWGNVKTGVYAANTMQTAHGSQVVAATGVQTVSVTGLTTGTAYYGYLVHINAGGFQSIVASAGPFTP